MTDRHSMRLCLGLGVRRAKENNPRTRINKPILIGGCHPQKRSDFPLKGTAPINIIQQFINPGEHCPSCSVALFVLFLGGFPTKNCHPKQGFPFFTRVTEQLGCTQVSPLPRSLHCHWRGRRGRLAKCVFQNQPTSAALFEFGKFCSGWVQPQSPVIFAMAPNSRMW